MRIALVTETFVPRIDGIVTRLTHTVEALCRAGHEVLVVAPDGGPPTYAGATVVGLPAFPIPFYTETRLALPRPGLGRVLDRFRPDVVHVASPVLLGLAGIAYARARRIPLVASYHVRFDRYAHYLGAGHLEGRIWRGLRLMHRQADVNLCTSSAALAVLRANGIPRVALWQRAVDVERFHPDRARPEMWARLAGLPAGTPAGKTAAGPVLLYVGRLAPEKEVAALLPLVQRLPGARLAIVGDGPQRAELERRFRGTATTFLGYLRGEALAAAYASSDVFVFPSRTDTLGMVLLEALASGCPVVAPRAGGVPDVVQDGVTGFLFPPDALDASDAPDRSDGLLAATQRALAHGAPGTPGAAALRARARQEAERWTWTAATRQLEGYYRQAQEADVHRAPLRPLTAAGDLALLAEGMLHFLVSLLRHHLRTRRRRAGWSPGSAPLGA